MTARHGLQRELTPLFRPLFLWNSDRGFTSPQPLHNFTGKIVQMFASNISSKTNIRGVIVVVEGPSGAGKTTWVRRHGGHHAVLEPLPDHASVPTDPEAAARFWVDRNVARWNEVLERERRAGLVIVDTDPFKLHYVWTLWKAGRTTEREWQLQRDAARSAFAAGRYGLADVALVADIDEGVLRARRDADGDTNATQFRDPRCAPRFVAPLVFVGRSARAGPRPVRAS
jgi:hypothetical protein